MSDSDLDPSAVVIDNGSGIIKAGFAGDDCHSVVLPTIIANLDADNRPMTSAKYVFGEEARSCTNKYELIYPMEHGIVTNWYQMELLWNHMFFQELRVKPEEYPCLITEPALNPKANREKMAQVMFETYRVPAFFVCVQGILAMYASGRGSGIAVTSGDTVTDVMIIYEGHTVAHAMSRAEIGGRNLTNYMAELLHQKGHAFETTSEREIVRTMKERHCYVAFDVDQEMYDARMSRSLEKSYELPDGSLISVNEERFRCPEALFQPSLIGLDEPGLHKMVQETIKNCPIDMRRDLRCNIILAGGNTMFPGMSERLKNEICRLTPGVATKVVAPPERRSSVWIGGSILASLSTFQELWVTKQQYEEHGPSFIHRKCI